MKTIPPICPEPETGRKYWRGLDHMADTPEFREWLEREFPQGASELTDPVSRRHFVKIMSASLALAGVGLTGCRRPEAKILPFSKQPENYIHGVPQYYATAMPTRGGAIPLVVKSSDGRPTKVEGNTEFAATRVGEKNRRHAGTDHYAQASILSLYDPDRAQRFAKSGNGISREAAFDFLRQQADELAGTSGKGLAVLLQRNTSPSRERLIESLASKYPNAKWFAHEPVDFDIHREAASIAFGKSVVPQFKLDAAKVIVALDCDFIGSEENTVQHSRDFVAGRRISKPTDSMNRLYVIEPMMTLTGANADHRLRVPASRVASITEALSLAVSGTGVATLLSETDLKWITECAKDLAASKGASLVVAGYRQPLAVHVLAYAINEALGNIGKTVVLHEVPQKEFGSIELLSKDLASGAVETLVIVGGNPVYDAPADLNWEAAQKKANAVIRWGYYENDETGSTANYHFPATHYLESWGDARAFDGSLVPVQPLIAPLFDGITELEFLARLGGFNETNPHEIVRASFREFANHWIYLGNPFQFTEGSLEELWKKFLHEGFLASSAPAPTSVALNSGAVAKALAALQPSAAASRASLEIIFHRDYSVDDGRWNNNGWLQELPDPITKLTWENAVLVSPKTAKDLGILSKSISGSSRNAAQKITIEFDGRSITAPAWIQPGMADNVLALALGYGREKTGRVGDKSGYNAYKLRTTKALHFGVGAKVSVTSDFAELATTQGHWAMEGRPIVREANLQQFKDDPKFAEGMNAEEPKDGGSLYPNPLDINKSELHQWGMSVDLNSCVGCNACVIACQSENNVPIVGKLLVSKSREMHWLRIDRYFASNPALPEENQMDDPQVVTQPMMCQHCESAPCESVCPVNATVHDNEGLNLMVYNRCVGTRYCSNNCSWKVRRFNYFDYNRRPLGQALYKPPFVGSTDGEWELSRWFKDPSRGSKPEDEWDLIRLAKNPDVTVRMRGIMEKCTFCVQRIEQAKISQKVKARASGDVQVPDGTFTTACAQACPTDAIVFGNVLDKNSRVSQLKEQERDYTTLEFLATKPRLTYLARVRNPNPEMPDYYEIPMTTKEFRKKNHKTGEHELKTGAHESKEGEKH